VKAVSETPFYIGEFVECTLMIHDESLNVTSRIVRARRLKDAKQYELGIQFHDISALNQDKIIAFVFMKQAELRKKGLK
jgi:c-di-GMP-binding flagellar brake protein YcgR